MRSLVLENLEVDLQGLANPIAFIAEAKTALRFDELLPGAHVAITGTDPTAACILARCAGLSFRDTILINETRQTIFVPLFRKPLEGTVVENLAKHNAGALHLRSVQFPISSGAKLVRPPRTANKVYGGGKGTNLTAYESDPYGRWPANLIMVHDRSCTNGPCVDQCAVRLFQRQLPSADEGDRFYMIASTHEEAILYIKKLIGETV